MSHPRALIEKIANQLATEYPRELFDYTFEKCYAKTRMMPDILITREGHAVCIVEIGYTRPEKLTAYRQSVPDVRWYDKQGQLHGDVQERIIQVAVQLAAPSPVYIYRVKAMVPCYDCTGLFEDCQRRIPTKCYERYVRRYGLEAALNREEEIYEREREETLTTIVTDYVRAWLPSYCDYCGNYWLASLHDEGEQIASILEAAPREIAKHFGAREEGVWADIVTWFEEAWDLQLRPDNGDLVDEFSARKMEIEIHREIAKARRD